MKRKKYFTENVKESLKLERLQRTTENEVNYIIISPGININKTRFKSILFKNKKKLLLI